MSGPPQIERNPKPCRLFRQRVEYIEFLCFSIVQHQLPFFIDTFLNRRRNPCLKHSFQFCDTKPLQQLPTSETKEATPQRKTTNKAPEKKHTQRQHIVNTVAKATKQTNIESSDPLNLYTPDATDAQSEQILMDLAEADIFINPYTD